MPVMFCIPAKFPVSGRSSEKPGDDDVKKIENIMGKLKEADSNKDGCYSKDELKNALKELGAIFPNWRANRCLGEADADHDGQISGDEIKALIKYLLSRGYGK